MTKFSIYKENAVSQPELIGVLDYFVEFIENPPHYLSSPDLAAHIRIARIGNEPMTLWWYFVGQLKSAEAPLWVRWAEALNKGQWPYDDMPSPESLGLMVRCLPSQHIHNVYSYFVQNQCYPRPGVAGNVFNALVLEKEFGASREDCLKANAKMLALLNGVDAGRLACAQEMHIPWPTVWVGQDASPAVDLPAVLG